MSERIGINPRQFFILVTTVTIGDSVLVLPAVPAFFAKQDAWLSGIAGLCFGMLNVALLMAAGRLYPEQDFFSFVDQLFGKIAGKIVALAIVMYAVYSAAAHVMETGDFIGTHLLTETPPTATNLLFVALIIFGVRLGLETVARAAEIYVMIFILFFVILMGLLAPQAEIAKLQPIMENGLVPVMEGAITAIAFPYSELVIFLVILPFVQKPVKRLRNLAWGAFCGGVVLIIILLMCILVLGADQTARHLYPSYTLAKQLHIGSFIQRVEVIIAWIWFITVFIKITMYTLVAHMGLAHVFRLQDYRAITIPYAMLLLVLSLIFAPNLVVFNEIVLKYWPFYDFTYSLGIPLLLICGYAIYKRRNDKAS